MIDFDKLTRHEHMLCMEIAKVCHYRGMQEDRSRMDIAMDVAATHLSNPLRLEALLESKEFDFAHDVLGIARHLNRETGQLEDHFSPRYSA